MQRRLATAFALIALSAVVLVGLGIVLLAERGARQQATTELSQGLEAIADLSVGDRAFGSLRPALARSQQAFGFESLQVVAVTDDGGLIALHRADEATGRPAPLPDEGGHWPISPLSEEQQTAFSQDQVVVFDGSESVSAIRRLDIRLRDGGVEGVELGLLASRQVLALPGRTIQWFLLSGAVVLAGSVLAGLGLARRLVHPIQAVQRTTAALAAGNLDARTTIEGDDELADLGRSVNVMAAELERSKRLDQQFLMSVSHDLRTPLTAIGGYAEALIDGTADNVAEVGAVIESQARRLERLVQDLLDLARLDANEFTLDQRPIDLAVIAGRTVAEWEPVAHQHGLQLDFVRLTRRPVMVMGDSDRLTQVVGNLIDNSTKFASSSVQISVLEDGPRAVVTVSDDGPGISDEDLPHIFDRLYAGKSQPRRSESSTGLGLTIVRELASAMSGSVDVDLTPMGGTVFSVSLPLLVSQA